MEAAYHRRWRPARYWLAGLIGAAVLLVIIASSVLAILFQEVPARGTLFGLPAAALILAATVFAVRALHDHQLSSRLHDLLRAGVLLGLGLLLWLAVVDVFTFTRAAGPGVAAACALACLPTTAIGLLVVRRLDRNEKEPWRLVMVAVAWGAIVSTSLVVWAEALWDSLASQRLLPGPALDVSTAYSAGIWEEIAKGVAVLLLYLVMRDEFDDVVDGIVYGAAVGLGFNFMESVTYMTHIYAVYAGQGSGAATFAAASQWYSRQVLGLFFGHATYTALVGAGIGVARQLPRLGQRVLCIAAGFLAAIAAHFAWDAWVALFPISNSPFALVEVHLRTLVMQGPFTAAVLVLLAMGLQLEGDALGRQLSAEAATNLGTVLPEEIPVLIRPWHRFRARLRAAGRDGPAGYSRLHRLQTAQLDLAMERWHRERHEIDEPLAAEEVLRDRVLVLRGQLA
jgi:RsiW-degrading membrane proteinase PrsW (M82 family)